MLVQDFLQEGAARTPEKTALVCDGQRLTYAQVAEQANRIANGLPASGVERGDRVAIWLPNSVEAVAAIFGTLQAGATFLVINATTKRDKLAYILQHCGASALFAPARETEVTHYLLNTVPSLRCAIMCGKGGEEARIGTKLIPYAELLASNASTCPPCKTIDLDLACLIYTSGSTGDPKGVMSTHANVTFSTASIIEYLGNGPEDVVINVLPLSFDYGLYQLLMTFKFGGTLVLEHSFAYPAALLKKIEQERVTGLPGVPTLFAILLKMDLTRFELSSLRYLTNTAAALPVAHIERLRKAFAGAKLFSMYGLTECKRALYLPPEELDHRPASVGIPIPGTEAWVQDESGHRLDANQVGELVIRGSHVMQGYWNDPAETAKRYRKGRYPAERLLYTGDLFRTDEEGFFYFVARQDDVIKSRGEKVAPKEVESALYGLPGVAEVAVVGVTDELLGQAVKAIIVREDGAALTEREVIRYCSAHLDEFCVPKHVEFRGSLPTTPSGKIDRRALG